MKKKKKKIISTKNRKPWKDYLREARGGLDSQMGVYAHSYMKPDFDRSWGGGTGDRFEKKYATRHGKTGLIGENSWMMYRHALPTDFEMHPDDPIKGNDWMKLHEKNPMYLSRFCNAQGMPYAPKYSGLKAGAHAQLMVSISRARHLGLLPVWGNPYFQKHLENKPTPRVSTKTIDHVDNYRTQWIENERIKSHFDSLKKISSEAKKTRSVDGTSSHLLGQLPHFPASVQRNRVYERNRFHYALSHTNPLDGI